MSSTSIDRLQLTLQGTWERVSTLQLGSASVSQQQLLDWTGRTARLIDHRTNGALIQTDFHWLGSIYLGRDQSQPGLRSLFRESRTLDEFGLPLKWRYTAIELGSSAHPLDPADGATYCGAPWDVSACGSPLLTLSALRDPAGRLASHNTDFGHPVFGPSGRLPAKHPTVWNGFTYDPMARLRKIWEDPGTQQEVRPIGLKTHSVSQADIEQLGASSPQLEYTRETAVGAPLAVHDVQTSASVWSASRRGPGHQLQTVTVDGVSRALSHNDHGQLIHDGPREYTLDVRGALHGVSSSRGNPLECYLYDGVGRLVAVLAQCTQNVDAAFGYQGPWMIASVDRLGHPLWEASWRPEAGHLLGWYDYQQGTGEHIALTDARNSVVADWNASTARLIGTARYTADGRLFTFDPDGNELCAEQGHGVRCDMPGRSPFGWTSAWRSSISRLYYFRNRWYSPELGQFISHDPIGYANSYNLYAYVGFDPINGWDPFGLSTTGFTTNAIPQRQGRGGGVGGGLAGPRPPGPPPSNVRRPGREYRPGSGPGGGFRPPHGPGGGVRRPRRPRGDGPGLWRNDSRDTYADWQDWVYSPFERRQMEETLAWVKRRMSELEAERQAALRAAALYEKYMPGQHGIPRLDPCDAPCSPVREPGRTDPLQAPGGGSTGPMSEPYQPTAEVGQLETAPPNLGNAPQHGGPLHDARINQVAQQMQQQGWLDIRKNQQQVDQYEVVVGTNRPDISGINPYTMQRVNIEFDTDPAASHRHMLVVVPNDPNAINVFIVIDPNTGGTIWSTVFK